jgi:hypothetical protein
MRRLIEQRLLLKSINDHMEQVNGTVAAHARAIDEMKLLHAQREKSAFLAALFALIAAHVNDVFRRPVG